MEPWVGGRLGPGRPQGGQSHFHSEGKASSVFLNDVGVCRWGGSYATRGGCAAGRGVGGWGEGSWLLGGREIPFWISAPSPPPAPVPLGDIGRAGSAAVQFLHHGPAASVLTLPRWTLERGNEGDLWDPGGPQRRESSFPPTGFLSRLRPRATLASSLRGFLTHKPAPCSLYDSPWLTCPLPGTQREV